MAPPAEITIPSTSIATPPPDSADSKPYTLYTITLRLPLRSFVVQKRYSEFEALHKTLVELIGAPPPTPLPAKRWFRSTVSDVRLTEERRAGLEMYLRAIAESPDRRWRDTTAWKAFLNLPTASTSTSAASASGVRIDGSPLRGGWGNAGFASPAGASSVAIDPTAWLDGHRELRDTLREARSALGKRDGAADATARAGAAAAAGKALVRAGGLLNSLSEGLRLLKEGRKLGEGELRRRQDMLSVARMDRDGLEKLSSTVLAAGLGGAAGATNPPGLNAPAGSSWGRLGTSGLQADRNALLGDSAGRVGGGGGGRVGRVLGAPLQETDRTRELDNTGVLLLQEQMLEDQDAGVRELGEIVKRQRDIALRMQDEVHNQTEGLDRMTQQADRLGLKIGVADRRVRKIN